MALERRCSSRLLASASANWNKGARSPWATLSKSTRPDRPRVEAPDSRDDRSASSIRFKRPGGDDHQQGLAQDGRRHDVE